MIVTASIREAKTRINYKLSICRRSKLVVTPRRHEVIALLQIQGLLAKGDEEELVALVHQLSTLSLWVQHPNSDPGLGSHHFDVNSEGALDSVTDWLALRGLNLLRSIEERIPLHGHEAAFEFALFARSQE